MTKTNFLISERPNFKSVDIEYSQTIQYRVNKKNGITAVMPVSQKLVNSIRSYAKDNGITPAQALKEGKAYRIASLSVEQTADIFSEFLKNNPHLLD